MTTKKVEVYILDVRAPKTDSKRYPITDVLTIGSDLTCDIALKDFGLSPLQGRFRFQNGILTFTNLGLSDSCKIGSQKCGEDRRYIIDKGDKFICGNVKVIIRKEKVDAQESPLASPSSEDIQTEELEEEIDTEEQEEDQTEVTDPAAPLGAYEELEEEYTEVEVYVDEDGNEVTPQKKMGFFARLKQKREVKKAEKEKAKKVQLKGTPKARGAKLNISAGKIKTSTASIFSRFLGFIFNIIFYLLFINLVPPLLIEHFDIDIFKMLSPLVEMITPLLEKGHAALVAIPQVESLLANYPEVQEGLQNRNLLEKLVAFILYDIFFGLILGVGLGQFLIGLTTEGSFLIVRALSPLRVLFGYLTLPLLIFDIPILLKKASFKEVISFTRIINRSLFFNIFSALILMPILIFIIGNYKLLPEILKLPAPIQHTETNYDVNKGSLKEVEFYLRSYGFNREGKTFFRPEVEIIPTLTGKGMPKDSPLTFFNNKKNHSITLHPQVELIAFKEIFNILEKDPTFSIRHSQVLKTFEESTADESGVETFEMGQSQFLIKSLYEVFSLNYKDPIRALRTLGPFIGPYDELKNTILEKLSIGEVHKVDLAQTANSSYLKLSLNEPAKVSYLIGTSSKGLNFIKIESTKGSSLLSKRILERLIIQPGEFKKDYAQLMKELKKDKEKFNRGFMAHAILTRITESGPLNSTEIRFFTDYFMTMAAKAIKTENESFQVLLQDTMQVMDKALLRLKKRNEDKLLSKLRLGLLRIQKALLKKDLRFFKINKK